MNTLSYFNYIYDKKYQLIFNIYLIKIYSTKKRYLIRIFRIVKIWLIFPTLLSAERNNCQGMTNENILQIVFINIIWKVDQVGEKYLEDRRGWPYQYRVNTLKKPLSPTQPLRGKLKKKIWTAGYQRDHRWFNYFFY